MAFFNQTFLHKRRQQWLRSIHAVEMAASATKYGADEWKRGEINQKKIEGDKLVIMATFPELDAQQWYIKAIRLVDVSGTEAAVSYKDVTTQKGQGTMIKIEFPIYEVTK